MLRPIASHFALKPGPLIARLIASWNSSRSLPRAVQAGLAGLRRSSSSAPLLPPPPPSGALPRPPIGDPLDELNSRAPETPSYSWCPLVAR
ncbi:hypothetical protein THAOC_23986, partial [Thalassiosira oceanica]